MWDWTKWPSEGLLMSESVCGARRERWSWRKEGQDGYRDGEITNEKEQKRVGEMKTEIGRLRREYESRSRVLENNKTL